MIISKNKYRVIIKRKINKSLHKCPNYIQERFWDLVQDLRISGPIQKGWKNFSQLDKDVYHCHLDYSWVAVWKCEKGSIIVEVTYVGSRERAPY